MSVAEITPAAYLVRRAQTTPIVMVDVREDWELKVSPVPVEVVHIPLGRLADRAHELDPQIETVVVCRSGGRSLQGANFLASRGFRSVYNLSGGILAWSRDIDPKIPVY